MWTEDIGGRDFIAAVSVSPAETLDRLSRSHDSAVRWAVAGNTYAPTATLTYLALDTVDRVVEQVAINPSTPPAVKMWLKSYRNSIPLEEFLRAVDSGD